MKTTALALLKKIMCTTLLLQWFNKSTVSSRKDKLWDSTENTCSLHSRKSSQLLVKNRSKLLQSLQMLVWSKVTSSKWSWSVTSWELSTNSKTLSVKLSTSLTMWLVKRRHLNLKMKTQKFLHFVKNKMQVLTLKYNQYTKSQVLHPT